LRQEASDTDNQTRKSSGRPLLAAVVKVVLAAVVIYFAGRQLVANWAEVSQYHWTLHPPLMILSIVLHLLTFVIFSKTWCLLIHSFGFDVPLKYGFKISYITNLGRYIPGKIWPVFGMVYLLNRLSISKEVAFASWGVATIFGMPAAFLAGFITIFLYPEMLTGISEGSLGIGPFVVAALTFTASFVLVVSPRWAIALFNWFLRLIRRPTVNFELGKKVALQVYLGYFIGWICFGVSFYTFMNAIMVDPEIPIIAGVGSFVLAYIIGYLAFFSPGGLGARELVLITVISPFLGPVASGVAVTARVWNLISEIVAALIALLIKMEGKRA